MQCGVPPPQSFALRNPWGRSTAILAVTGTGKMPVLRRARKRGVPPMRNAPKIFQKSRKAKIRLEAQR